MVKFPLIVLDYFSHIKHIYDVFSEFQFHFLYNRMCNLKRLREYSRAVSIEPFTIFLNFLQIRQHSFECLPVIKYFQSI